MTYRLLAALALLSGCTLAPSIAARSVQSADERMVARCEYIDEVTGWSGWGNLAQGPGMENARNQARDRAGRMGATHIVWRGLAGGYSPNVVGRAYRCAPGTPGVAGGV